MIEWYNTAIAHYLQLETKMRSVLKKYETLSSFFAEPELQWEAFFSLLQTFLDGYAGAVEEGERLDRRRVETGKREVALVAMKEKQQTAQKEKEKEKQKEAQSAVVKKSVNKKKEDKENNNENSSINSSGSFPSSSSSSSSSSPTPIQKFQLRQQQNTTTTTSNIMSSEQLSSDREHLAVFIMK
jgi:hypothetical protein